MILLSCLVMLIGLWQMYDNYYIFHHTAEKTVLQYKPNPNAPAEGDSPITNEMVAWLTVDDTEIDCPVMQGDDNLHFLNIDPFGNYSLSGSIFLDSRCSPDFSDSYSLIYGHHMDYGKMFGALDNYMNEEFLKNHLSGTLMVGRNAEKVYHLKIFASMRVNASEKTVFDMNQEYIRQFIREQADIFTEDAPEDSPVLALSTCESASSMMRIVVFCFLYE